MPIHTVLGPIRPQDLGRTSMHEHLIVDASVWYEPPAEAERPASELVGLENRGFLQWNPLGLADNLVIDDDAAVADELNRVKEIGGSGIVDLTVIGLGRQVKRLPAISRQSGLHVMVGCGFYIHESHPTWVEKADVDELTEFLLAELGDGVGDSGILPALIGEIGTSSPITDRERKVLIAAGQSAAETGSAVNVHIDRRGPHALEAVEILTGLGVDPGRVICSHLDERLDLDYHLAVAESGAIIEYDTFGQEYYFGPLDKNPSDAERLKHLDQLLEHGYRDQIVLGCDIWVKSAMATFGGMGYEHLLRRIAPALELDLGAGPEVLEQILIETPRRLLNRP